MLEYAETVIDAALRQLAVSIAALRQCARETIATVQGSLPGPAGRRRLMIHADISIGLWLHHHPHRLYHAVGILLLVGAAVFIYHAKRNWRR